MAEAGAVVATYYALEGLYALAMGLTQSVDDLFLLHAGLSMWSVFLVGAAFTAALVLFEIPTGVVADTVGRRASVLASLAVRSAGSVAYVAAAWAPAALRLVLFCGLKVVMGLGFTFYSGAIDAWLVDALRVMPDSGGRTLDQVFARGAAISRLLGLLGMLGGAAMAQGALGIPFAMRGLLLGCTLVAAAHFMHDTGFSPTPLTADVYVSKVVEISRASARYGWSNKAVRMIMLASFSQAMLTTWGFYAWHSHLLTLYGDVHAVWLIGVVSALVSCARSLGNLLVDALIASGLVRHRTTVMLGAMPVLSLTAIALGRSTSFAQALCWLMCLMATMGVVDPVRQAFLHREIPSGQRATVISFQQMFVGGGSVLGQLTLGYCANVASIPAAYVVGGCLSLLSLPPIFLLRSFRRHTDAFVPTTSP